jgi:hypothetical protein
MRVMEHTFFVLLVDWYFVHGGAVVMIVDVVAACGVFPFVGDVVLAECACANHGPAVHFAVLQLPLLGAHLYTLQVHHSRPRVC